MSEKESSKRIRLIVEGGPTREFSGDRAFVIGRSQNVDFSIPHPNLSREHVRISLKEGEVWLEDLGSANGTFVQGKRIAPNSIIKVKTNYRILLGTGSNVVISLESVEASGPLESIAPPKGDVDLPTAHEPTMTSQQRSLPNSVAEFEASKTMTKSRGKLELDYPVGHFPQEIKKEKVAELRIMEAKKQRVLEDIQYKEREVDDLRSKIRTLREESLKLKEQTENFQKEIQPLAERKFELEERVAALDLTYEEKIDSLEAGFSDLKETLEESHSVRMARAEKDYKEKIRKLDDDYARKLQDLESGTQAVRAEGQRLQETLFREKGALEENLKKVRTEAKTLEAERRLSQVRIDTEIAQLQGMKMKLENELEIARRKHESVTAETRAIFEQGRLEVAQLEATRKAMMDVRAERDELIKSAQAEQEQFKAAIEEIKQSESKNLERIQELKSVIAGLQGEAQSIEGIILKSKTDAETIIRLGHEEANAAKKIALNQIEEQREAVRKNADAQAAARIQAAEAQANARMSKASEDSRAVLERAQAEGNQYYEAKKMAADELYGVAEARAREIETGSKDQAERVTTQAMSVLESKRHALEAELVDLRRRSDQEIRQVRQNAITAIEAAQERESKDFSGRLKGRVKEIGDQIERIVGSKLAAQHGVHMDPVSMKAFSNEIHTIVETVIGAPKSTGTNDKTMSAILPNTQAQQRVVRYWKKMGIAAAVIFALVLGKVLVPGAYTYVGNVIASAIDVKDNTDAVVKRMLRERQLAMVFVTQQDQNFRDTYTDNILYTEGFIEMKEDVETQKAWTLGLNKFFQGELGLTEKAIVQFGSAEGRMIRSLIDLRKDIIPQTSSVGIQKMRDLEAPIVKEMKFIVHSDANWKRFQAFHRDYYEKYTQTFINRAPASKD